MIHSINLKSNQPGCQISFLNPPWLWQYTAHTKAWAHPRTTHTDCSPHTQLHVVPKRGFLPSFCHYSDMTEDWTHSPLNTETLNFSGALVRAFMKQPKLRADTGCRSSVNLLEDHTLLWVNTYYVLNPVAHLPMISSAVCQDRSGHCGSPLG